MTFTSNLASTNTANYYVRQKGWFNSSLSSVSREEFLLHRSKTSSSQSFISSVNALIKNLALGILGVYQTMPFSVQSGSLVQHSIFPFLTLHACSLIPVSSAQMGNPAPGPQGDEFQVNNRTIGRQTTQQLVPLNGGGFAAYYSDGQIFGQLFNVNKEKIGEPFSFFSETSSKRPNLISLVPVVGAGSIALLQSDNGATPPTFRYYAQLYDNSAALKGSEFEIFTYTVKDKFYSLTMGARSNSDSITIFTSRSSNTSATSAFNNDCYGQIYSATGVKRGGEFSIINSTDIDHIKVATNDNHILVTWDDEQTRSELTDVFGAVFDWSGNRLGSELKISSTENSRQENAYCAALKRGGFVVVWQGSVGPYQREIFGQILDASGNKFGKEFQVNADTMIDLVNPKVAPLEGGGFVVVWNRRGRDGTSPGVFGQEFDAMGVKVGDEVQIDVYSKGNKDDVLVAGLQNGNYVVIWDSFPAYTETAEDAQDGSEWGVFGRILPTQGTKPSGTIVSMSNSGAAMPERHRFVSKLPLITTIFLMHYVVS